ncbi:MAG: hypothetical protein MAG551_01403 [Candidatus Scalindua arabica]|uniref:ATPase n=1 Tax=Candidatus Scalindua arabica TaxID=1127984 RepID=A0A942A0U7_9BACT|nr:hypothetical protein [Candidatus Scalindua arabica]
MNEYYKRKLQLPDSGDETFFLWGARQTGKSTLLKKTYPRALWIDLLKSEEYRRYIEHPEYLREEIARSGAGFVVIDEIQKVPAILDEVHWLHENRKIQFALCGSSARKLRKGHANLLGGRGVRYELFGFSASELRSRFDLTRMLNHGYFPRIYSNSTPKRLLNNYVSQYLKDEVAAEGLVRRLPSFSQFLNMASLSDCELVNYSTIARDTGVSSETIRGYFEILCDSLLGKFLHAYRRRPKRRITTSPKFYFSDVGVVNFLAKRGKLEPGGELYGKAFENWVFHELCSYDSYKEKFSEICFWRLSSGIEVDFVVNHMDCAIEAKASNRITKDHLKGLRQLSIDHPNVKKRIVVCLDNKDRLTEDDIEIINYQTFIKKLWAGNLF